VILNDIRFDIDEVIAGGLDSPLVILNLDVGEPPFTDEEERPLELTRRDAPVALSSGPLSVLVDAVARWQPGSSILLTNLRTADLRELAPLLPENRHVIGFHNGIGFSVLVGPGTLPEHWRSRRSTPLGMPTLVP
jgi:hypothetical protein